MENAQGHCLHERNDYRDLTVVEKVMQARVVKVTFLFRFCFSRFDTLGGPGECKTCLQPSCQLGQVRSY